MYSEELMTYLYSYNLSFSKKEEEVKKNNRKNVGGKFKKEIPLLHVLKSASVTVPLDFKHDAL